jgi:hypothetical protein
MEPGDVATQAAKTGTFTTASRLDARRCSNQPDMLEERVQRKNSASYSIVTPYESHRKGSAVSPDISPDIPEMGVLEVQEGQDPSMRGMASVKQAVVTPPLKRMASQTSRKSETTRYLKAAYLRVAEIEHNRLGLVTPGGRASNHWDMVLVLALLFTSFITPYEVAVLAIKIDGLFALNRVVDLVFLTDVWVNMHLMYLNDYGRLISNRAEIRRRYTHGWLTVDIITLLPYDLLSLLVDHENRDDIVRLRLIRLLRLVKLLRIVRASRVFERWEFQVGLIHSTVVMYKLAFGLIVINHWFACAWAMGPYLEDPEDTTWVSNWIDARPEIREECTSQLHAAKNGAYRVGCFAPFELYTSGLYFAAMTVTSIGYGDITPANQNERFFSVLFMLASAIFWAVIMGNIVRLTSSSDDDVATQYYDALDELNGFMCKMDVHPTHRFKVRRYMAFSKSSLEERSYKNMLRALPPELANEMQSRPRYMQVGWQFSTDSAMERSAFPRCIRTHVHIHTRAHAY